VCEGRCLISRQNVQEMSTRERNLVQGPRRQRCDRRPMPLTEPTSTISLQPPSSPSLPCGSRVNDPGISSSVLSSAVTPDRLHRVRVPRAYKLASGRGTL
jgi:hypothetical protein